MKYLLDTNICIYLINTRPEHVLQRFRRHAASEVGISAITVGELASGVAKSGSERHLGTLERFLAPLEVVPFDDACAWHYGRLRAALARVGTPIGAMDQLIAAHALSLDLTLVTHNTREFQRVPGLRVENWAELPE